MHGIGTPSISEMKAARLKPDLTNFGALHIGDESNRDNKVRRLC